MEQNNSTNFSTGEQLPKYGDILNEVGKQLNLRKKDIFKRVITTTWPMAVFGGVFTTILVFFKDSLSVTLTKNQALSLGVH